MLGDDWKRLGHVIGMDPTRVAKKTFLNEARRQNKSVKAKIEVVGRFIA
jgi:pyrroloquinoline quinone (PQQ) biosynthesis protein C